MPERSTKLPIRIRPLLAACAVLGLSTVATFASFTDNDTASTMFSTGTVDLALDATGSDLRNWTTLGMENAKPGDVTYAPLVVSNIGTLDFTYSMATTAVGDEFLASALLVTIVSGATQCDATGFADGTEVLAESPLINAALANRPLAANSATPTKEALCFKVSLPASAGNTLQDAGVNIHLSFTATQAA
ncbi:TasA family protein [Cryobacterium tepidiphilum]|uniref:Ribosomally synthesized peptide with SipW-like signal peptide n=1 Tax=Cryobacterium tepidiphilum TaxID=2486026 RepID=A0A3M8KTQ9_9MICO|nr:TasA family protein [Cryobacterium tepidiphilum]RNE56633.1 hypothetical protein EEJ31_13220 [Cryobacterium tepidiphilum]